MHAFLQSRVEIKEGWLVCIRKEEEDEEGGKEDNQDVGIAENEENLNRVFTLLTHVDCDRWD